MNLYQKNDQKIESCIHEQNGHQLIKQGLNKEAEISYRKAIKLNPENELACFSLGVLLSTTDKNNHEEAFNLLFKAKNINPALPQINLALASLFIRYNQFYKARLLLVEELKLVNISTCNYLENIYHQLLICSSHLGQIDDACNFCKKLISINPMQSDYLRELIYLMSHSKNYTDIDINNTAKEFYSLYFDKQLAEERLEVKKILENKNHSPKYKVRIGILSPHFHAQHAESLLIDIFEKFDKNQFELHCFYDDEIIDDCTKRYMDISKSFNFVHNIDRLDIAKNIIDKGIDILIDTLGHVNKNRLDVFSLKPAPIQVSFYGYWASSGLMEMDCYIATKNSLNTITKESYSEKVYEINNYYFQPKIDTLNEPISPFTKNNFISFGCFNRGQKINDEVLNIWSKILYEQKNSRLILSYLALADDDFCNYLYKFFEEKKIARERIILIKQVSTEEYFNLYNQIDIALDPFPFSGACTSADALWMSTPIITMQNQTHAGSFTASFLELLETGELIAKDESDYINKAITLAKDTNRILKYKRELRNKFQNSLLMNATENARDIEKILLQLINSKGINITKQDSDEYQAQALFEKGLNLLENKNEQSEALKYLLKARKIKKDLPRLNFTLGKIFNKDAQYYKAYTFLKEEASLNNELISQEYLNHLLSWTSSYLGKIDESCSYAQAAIKHREDFLPYYNDLIFFMNHSDKYSDKDINNIAHQSYKNCLEKQFQIDRETIKLLLKNKPLRSSGKIKIGILSPYLQTNSAEFFIAEMLTELNQNEIEVHCFYDGEFIDTTTDNFIKYSQSFTHIQGHSTLEIAKIIIEKDIDILLDTLGHIRGNRLDVFSLKPAPIQACLIGYWGSTGLPQMDYHITSKGWLGEKAHETFSEKIIEIPFFYTTPRITDIQTTEAPCLNNGFTTFGCFNRGQKINIRLLNIWSIILSLVPNSKLILSYQALSETDFQEEIWKFFEKRNISNNRIKLIHRIDTRSYFELYNQIDIALDPFPFSGGCTTVDSLYMSTPLITKDSNNTAGRFSKSFLELSGAAELIAKDDNDYIFKAVELANDFPRITKYKHTLKNNLINSNFFDIKTCTKHFENALKEMVKQTKENHDLHNK